MNAYAQERTALQKPEERGVPSTAGRTSPTGSDAINNRSRGEFFSRTQIVYCVQPRRVFQFGIARSALGWFAE
jgi:hypothetical protein